MKNNWYDTKGWYAPLNSDSQDDPVLPGETAIGGGEQLKTAASGKKR